MQISGIQKTTLIDYPGKIACSLFFFGCNFKCGFCHNPELVVLKNLFNIQESEILEFLDKRRKYLDGICITGGEPLINDLTDFLRKIKKIGYKIKIDTNGYFPERLKQIINEDLVDYIAMDIKSDKENYGKITNSEIEIEKIERSIKFIIGSKKEYEFRTTLVRGFHDERVIGNIGKWLFKDKKPDKYVLQNFIPRKNKLIDKNFEVIQCFTEEELEDFKNLVLPYFKKVEIRC